MNRPAYRTGPRSTARSVAEHYGAHEHRGAAMGPPRSFVDAVRRLTVDMLVDEVDDDDDGTGAYRQVALPDPCPGASPRYVLARGGRRPDMDGLHVAYHAPGYRK